jgi:hypothetical protein
MSHLRRPVRICLLCFLLAFTACNTRQRQQGDEKTAQLAKKYDLDIVLSRPEFPVKTTHGAINGKEADHKDVDSYVPLLVSEWNLYPVELIKRSKLQRIILCQDLSFAGQQRTAIPDFEHNDLYFDVARGRHSLLYTRTVIHHEFFHVLDYRNGTLYADERWTRLLPKGVKYGMGGKNLQDDATVSLISDDLPGFLNKYSTTGVEEDKAEVFANMIVNSKAVEERAKNDPVIRAKTVLMRDILQSFCSKMDDRFWEAASKLDRSRREH